MSYRVELAVSGRAGCQATECKHAGIKIDKDDLRFGVWVDYEERGGWRWKHWGCVTGQQLQNLRKKLEIPGKPGTYDWDALDGYSGDDKGNISRDPELQEKVRRVVTQGFIDPDDFNGDPEMNKLGETGLRTAASKKAMREQRITHDHEVADLQEQLASVTAELEAAKQSGKSTTKIVNQLNAIQEQLNEMSESATPAKKKPAGKKRGRGAEDDSDGDSPAPTPAKKKRATKAKKEVDSDGEEVKPAPKKRATKAKKEEVDEDEAEDVKPAPKKRASRAKKEEVDEDADADADEEEVKPAPKKRATKVKKEIDEDGEEVKPARAKKTRSKKASIKEEEDQEMKEAEEVKPVQAEKARGKKAAVKKEESTDEAVKKEDGDDHLSAPVAPKKRAPRGKKAVKEESIDEEPAKPAPKNGSRKKAVKKEEESIKSESGEDTLMTNGETSTTLTTKTEEDVKEEPSDAGNIPSDVGTASADSEPATKQEDSIKEDEEAEEKFMVESEPTSQVEAAETARPGKGKGKKSATTAAQTTRGSRSRTASKA